MCVVNPTILVWARETAGMTLEAAAKAIELKTGYGKSGGERLALLESGEEIPSRSLLTRMAKKYRRPLLVFYLSSPPRKGDRGHDFRTFPANQEPVIDPTLDALLRDIKTRQRLVQSILEDDEAEPLTFVASKSLRHNPSKLAALIAETIGFDRGEYRKQRTQEYAFAYLRSRVEHSGAFILLIGDLGSHHTDIPARVFRGYAIADSIAPFIVINDNDHRAAWPFTAFHELAHLWIGATGISGSSFDNATEAFCNKVASEILLPADELSEIASFRGLPAASVLEIVQQFASERWLSVSMIAYRCLQAELISRRTWRDVSGIIAVRLLKQKEERRAKDHGDTGPNYYVVRRHRLGPSLVGFVGRYLREGFLTYTKAAKVLGVKPRNVEPLLYDTPPRGNT